MNDLIKIKMSDLNQESWPLFLKDAFSESGPFNSEIAWVIEPERKLCENCDYLFFDNDSLKFHSSELGVMNFDFSELASYHRKQNYILSKEPLARALGIKNREQKRLIWDTTCGTGKDSLLISSFGAELISFERNAVVYLLLKDASRRFAINFQIKYGDAQKISKNPESLTTALQRPEVIYYDPMYPAKKKSALPRKEMRIFKEIVGDDPDHVEFLTWARSYALERVVVKRSLEANPIHPNPTASYKGKSTRYDMYKIF